MTLTRFNIPSVNKERMMILNDGIFAICITLLVLDIRLPEIPGDQIDMLFLPGLVAVFPKILGFVLSFFIIASYWFHYHRIFSFIRDVDRQLIFLNVFFLFLIALMPFPTYLLGLYGDRVTIVTFYALIVALTTFLLFLMWRHVIAHEALLIEPLDDTLKEYLSVRNIIPTVVFLVSIGIALINPLAAMLSWVSLIVIMPVVKWRYVQVELKEGK